MLYFAAELLIVIFHKYGLLIMARRGTVGGNDAPKERVQASVPADVYQELLKRAELEKRSVSAVIALAIEAYLDGGQGKLPLKN